MTTNKARMESKALALALTFVMGTAGVAQAVTIAGASNPNTTAAVVAETVTTGTLTSVDVARGMLAVAGKVIHFTAKSATFSDDRRKPNPDGLEGLKAGDKVTVRSTSRDGLNQAIQIVVKD